MIRRDVLHTSVGVEPHVFTERKWLFYNCRDMAEAKIFISYSWTKPDHEDWVINLAERLTSDGVEVILDKWDLTEGQDKYNFMESMVKSTDIQKVLIILDKKYSEKAEQREGGVGTETEIISPKIYGDVSQEKFIPIVAEKDENGKPYLPTYLNTRIYIDLSGQDKFEEEYEKLLRNIFKRPAYRKPKLGNPPSYITEETPMTNKTSILLRSFEDKITKSPTRANSVIREFLEVFFEDLKGFSMNVGSTRNLLEIGKGIHDNIVSYTPLRNDYIYFLNKLLKSEVEFEIGIFINFFEKLPALKAPLDNRGSWSHSEFENFKFFIHEIFLYTIAVGLKNESYKFIEELLYSSYFFEDNYNNSNNPQRFIALYEYIEVFAQYYNQTYSKNFFSPMADMMITRLPDHITKDELINADLLCHYVSVIDDLRWFPITYFYKDRHDTKFALFTRLISLRHFEKVKCLFNVNTTRELQEKLTSKKEQVSQGYGNSFQSITPIHNLVNVESIGTIR